MRFVLDVRLTPAQVAEAFCELDDEGQAQAIIEIGRVAQTWEGPACMQWHLVGRHLRDCPCSTYEAREVIMEIAAGMEPECACRGTGRFVETSTAYGVATPVSRRCSCEAGRRTG